MPSAAGMMALSSTASWLANLQRQSGLVEPKRSRSGHADFDAACARWKSSHGPLVTVFVFKLTRRLHCVLRS